MILYNCYARRSGATMSITGVNALGIERTLTGIVSITPNASSQVIAKGPHGAVHELAIEPRP